MDTVDDSVCTFKDCTGMDRPVKHHNHRQSPTTIFKHRNASTSASSVTIAPPPVFGRFLEVEVIADLIDWSAVRLVIVELVYVDPDNSISRTNSLRFSPTNKANQTWVVDLNYTADADFTFSVTYQFSVTYHLSSGSQVVIGPTTTGRRTLILGATQ